ncbi:MAG: hypothetical protein WDN44_05155 [Sphingomonas sp.]
MTGPFAPIYAHLKQLGPQLASQSVAELRLGTVGVAELIADVAESVTIVSPQKAPPAGQPDNVRYVQADIGSRGFWKTPGLAPVDVAIGDRILNSFHQLLVPMQNLAEMVGPDGAIVLLERNGMATRSVLAEPRTKKFGVSLLAPDLWADYGARPQRAYYRSLPVLRILAAAVGLKIEVRDTLQDGSDDVAYRHVEADLRRIRQELRPENFESTTKFKPVRPRLP